MCTRDCGEVMRLLLPFRRPEGGVDKPFDPGAMRGEAVGGGRSLGDSPPPAVGLGALLRTECLWLGVRPLRDARPSIRPEDRVGEEHEEERGARDSEAIVGEEVDR